MVLLSEISIKRHINMKTVASKCDSTKRIIDVTSPPTEPKPKAGLF